MITAGSGHDLVWNAGTDLGFGLRTNIFLRTRARDITLLGDWSEAVPYMVDTIDTDSDGLPDSWEQQYLSTLA